MNSPSRRNRRLRRFTAFHMDDNAIKLDQWGYHFRQNIVLRNAVMPKTK